MDQKCSDSFDGAGHSHLVPSDFTVETVNLCLTAETVLERRFQDKSLRVNPAILTET